MNLDMTAIAADLDEPASGLGFQVLAENDSGIIAAIYETADPESGTWFYRQYAGQIPTMLNLPDEICITRGVKIPTKCRDRYGRTYTAMEWKPWAEFLKREPGMASDYDLSDWLEV